MWKALSRFSPFMKQCFVTAAVCSNLIGFGCVIGFPGILLPQLHRPDTLIQLTKEDDSWIASMIGITMLIGSFILAPIMGRLGRKVAHYTITCAAVIGWLVTIFAGSLEAIFVGRTILGLAEGMMLSLRSVLIGEYTSPKNRGAFLTTVSLAQGFGIFAVHLIGTLLSWQRTAVICILFHLTCLAMTVFSPESPSWLAAKGRYDECREVFRWLRGDNEEEELEDMIDARLDFDNAQQGRRSNNISQAIRIVKKKAFYKPIILMLHVFVMGQFSGCTSMASYSTTIITLIMGPGVNAHFWMIAIDTQRLISNTVAIFLINFTKRRTMMFATGGLCVAAHLGIAAYVYLKQIGILQYEGIWIPAILINLQFFSVATGMLSLPTVVGGEVFPLEYRSIAGSISLTAISLAFFTVLKTFPGLVDRLNIYGTYLVYAAILSYCLSVIWIMLPETKGKTLQQIEDELTGRKRNVDVEVTQTLNEPSKL